MNHGLMLGMEDKPMVRWLDKPMVRWLTCGKPNHGEQRSVLMICMEDKPKVSLTHG